MWVGQMMPHEQIVHLPPKTVRIWKYHFSYRELIFVGIIILVLAIFIIALSLTTSPKPMAKPCSEVSCLNQAVFITNNMDLSINPCQDFYTFACGNFGKQALIKSPAREKTLLTYLDDKNVDLIQTVLQLPVPANEDGSFSVERKLKDFFASCLDDFQHQKLGADPLMQAVDEYGGWALLDNWNNDDFNISNLIFKDKTKYWTKALFDVRRKFSDQKDEIISILPGGLGLAPFSYLNNNSNQAYKEFIKDVTTLLVRDFHRSVSEKEVAIMDFISSVYNIETEIAQIISDTWSNTTQTTVKALQDETNKILPDIQWAYLLQEIFLKTSFPESTVIYIKKDYTLKILEMIKNKPKIDIQNYFLWELMHTYVQDLTWEYSHTYRLFTEKTSQITSFTGLWPYCFQLVKRSFPDVLSYMIGRDTNELHDQTVAQATEFYEKVFKSFINDIDKMFWMDKKTKLLAKNQLGNIDRIFGNENRPREVAVLNEIYSTLKISRKQYFQNRLSINEFLRKKPEDELAEQVNRLAFETIASFVNSLNTLFYSSSVLQVPFYNQYLPLYMITGTFGFDIFKKLFSILDITGSNRTEAIEKILNCANENYYQDAVGVTYNGSSSIFPVKVDLPEAISNVAGLQLAYKFYKNIKSKEEPLLFGLPKVIANNDQAFFLAFGQVLCYTATDYQQWLDGEDKWYSYRHRVLNAVIQVPEFSQVFNCGQDSLVNRFKKCSIVS